MYMPKDIAILALDGNNGYLGKSFNLGDLSLRAEMLSVHVGFHKNVTDRLILGARAKIYMSSFNATSNKIQDISIPFRLKIRYMMISSDMQLNTSGISEYISKVTMETLPATLEKRLYSARIWDSGLTGTYYLKEYSVYSQYS
jgi:hypothetical protein